MKDKTWITKVGYPAEIIFHSEMGFYCGYITIDNTHPLFEKHYDKPNIQAHGGLTFSDYKDARWNENKTDKTKWIFGFDCGHAGDKTSLFSGPDDVFRDENYVTKECESLAKQLFEVKNES